MVRNRTCKPESRRDEKGARSQARSTREANASRHRSVTPCARSYVLRQAWPALMQWLQWSSDAWPRGLGASRISRRRAGTPTSLDWLHAARMWADSMMTVRGWADEEDSTECLRRRRVPQATRRLARFQARKASNKSDRRIMRAAANKFEESGMNI